MGSYWAALFLVVLATATPLAPPKILEEALDQLVDIYNQGPSVQNAFRLLQATPQPGLDSSFGNLQHLTFTIQETMCPASEGVDAKQCEFKPDGLMKSCSGYFSTEQKNPLIIITCDAVAQEPDRVTRFRGAGGFLKWFRRGLHFGSSNE